MSMRSFKMIGLALIGMACSGLDVSAQNPTKPPPASGQDAKEVQQRGSALHAGQHQNLIASCLVHDNQAEVVLGRIAMEKSQNGSVKKFANMMVQDHQEFLTKLQKFAPNAGELSRQIDASGRPKDGDRNDLNRDKPNPDRPNANNQDPNNQDPNNRNPNKQNRDRQDDRSLRGTGDSHDTSHVAVKLQREVAQQCLSDAQAKLSKEDGAEFDKCYMGMQIAKHSGMKSKLAVFSRHASDELKQLIDQSLQTTSAHLQEAESIMKELAGESDLPRGERRTGERPTTPAKSEKR